MNATDLALQQLSKGEIAGALPTLQRNAFSNPSYASYVNYAVALRHSGRFDDALTYLAKAVALDSKPPHAYLALGNVSTEIGEWQNALGYYESAFVRVDVTGAQFNSEIQQVALAYAQALLRQHMFKEAWPLWELGRFNRSYFALPGTKRWLGEPCSSLLVVCEGGYGDAMLFGRWLPFAKTRAKYVHLLIWDRMMDFRDWGALGVDHVMNKSVEVDARGIEYTTSWMSLPAIAGMRSVTDIPHDDGFIDFHRSHKWHNFAQTGDAWARDRIGYCWRAEENSTIRKSRSLQPDDFRQLANVLAQHGEVHSLVPVGKDLHNNKAPGDDVFRFFENVVQRDSELDGWAATASTIRSCKLIVTVDTAIAHLAGLCGVPTLLLLPTGSVWLWGTAENQPTDPWYGSHVHYYRNRDPLKWNIEEIMEAV